MRFSKQTCSIRVAALAAIVVCIAAASGCGGSGSSSKNTGGGSNTQVIAGAGPNVAALTVDEGPAKLQQLFGSAYLNGVFVTVNVCLPGTSTCQTIDHVLVDTGSIGLRLLDSSSNGEFNRASVPLIQEKDSNNNPIAECVQFVDGSYLWGGVATADVKLSSETASSVPVHIVGDTAFTNANPVPIACSTNGTNADTLQSLGTNGILGVGNLQQDCPGCVAVSGTLPPEPFYYTCPSGVCGASFATLTEQVQNPVALFATDNNGVIVELPTVGSSGAPSIPLGNGALVFGIGTQSNNALGSASVLTLDSSLNLSVSFKGTTYPASFIDSGSNALFFSDNATTGMPACTNSGPFFYCPSSPQNFTGTTQGANGTSTTTNFTIVSLDSQPAANFVFNNVGGPGSSQSFDWGLPFFMGRNVFVSIAGKTAPGGTPPYVAY
jgi:Protein of unknown function (DUF3443)